MSSQLPVILVDDHHHILQELHLAIRRRKLPFSGLHVVHVDAHPDLSFPKDQSCDVIFEPDALYDALEQSESGIAEFLLPQVLAGHISTLTWLKPSWATQFATGHHLMRVGPHVHSNSLRVDCDALYFVDEQLFAPTNEIDPKRCQTLDFRVRELDQVADSGDSISPATAGSNAFVLDIDLDYFSTWNPFLRDFMTACGAKGEEYGVILTEMFTSMNYKDMSNELLTSDRVDQRIVFVHEMTRLETDKLYGIDQFDAFCVEMAQLIALYDQNEAQMLLLRRFYDMLRSMDDTQRALVWWAGPCVDLPWHESSMGEIHDQVELLRKVLEAEANTPLLITIAKSVGDEYLPPFQEQCVVQMVLAMLGEIYDQRDIELVLKEVKVETENDP